MPEINKPNMSQIWASGGANVTPSSLKIQTGWTAEVPPFQWENWSQNRQDSAIAHLFQKGISVWAADQDYYFTSGGTKAYVQGSNGTLYMAVQSSTNQNPVTDVSNTYWVPFTGVGQSTESVVGAAKLATQAQTDAGTDDTTIVTPKKLKNGFQFLAGVNGYIVFPSWLGSFKMVWGVSPTQIPASGGSVTLTYPIPFTTSVYHVNPFYDAADTVNNVGLTASKPNLTTVKIVLWQGAGVTPSYIAFGV